MLCQKETLVLADHQAQIKAHSSSRNLNECSINGHRLRQLPEKQFNQLKNVMTQGIKEFIQMELKK